MKIEKINDNQIKFILNKEDLTERNIKLSELAYGSEKTQELFREMMLQAMIECDFHPNNTPLMIEAIPMSSDSIVIIVTKVTAPEEIENKFNYFTSQKDNSFLKPRKKQPQKTASTSRKKSADNNESVLVFSFDNIDSMANLSNRILFMFDGNSSSYKLDNKYYLVLENEILENQDSESYIESILSEYGIKHIATPISKYFLSEHGEVFIGDQAVEKLSKYINSNKKTTRTKKTSIS